MYRRHLTSSDERSEENDQDTMNVHNPFLDNSEMDNEIKNDSEASLLRGASEGNMGEPDYRGYYSRQGSQVPLVGQQRNLNVGQDQQGGNQSGPKNQQRLSPGRPATPAGISNNDIMSPQAFDRYPTVGSRAVSMALNPTQPAGRRGAHHAQGQNGHGGSTPGIGSSGSDQISLSSMASSNPFVGDQDFSPFGGYPASSFPLLLNEKEDDDYLHNPDPEEEARLDKGRFLMDLKYMDKRAAGGLFGFIFLFVGALLLFVVLPTLTYTGAMEHKKGSELEVLSLYQYPQLSAIRTDLVDPNTPSTARKRKALDGSDWILVFSDEFNAVGRTFYEGEDQFWTAPDIHYSATNDLEWYTPDASTTKDGVLQFRMDAFLNHNMYYRSGMLQSWNKLCFTQGALEISANLPNYGNILGLWPGLWTMGNLGRPGYLSTTEGVWPYAYDSCDAGITPNQSSYDGISFLPGQKLSACTCDGEDHPNLGVGRGAPEIDVIEGSVNDKLGVGIVSQSAQIAPFDIWYIPDYEYIEIYNQSITTMNTYCGGPFQQAVSAVSTLNNAWYEFGINSGYFQKYAIEYLNHNTKGYIRWFVGDEPTFTIYASALHPNGNVGWRRISKEPMSIIMNMGISNNWAYIDWQMIFFPVTMSVDYVRLYQPVDAVSVTCDPPGYPTYKYIQDHLGAYMNPNLTSWEDAGYSFPKNKLTGNCVASKYKEPTD